MKYIGKSYISGDNSYTESLSTKEWFPLAGTKWQEPKRVVIVSEPYNQIVDYMGKEYEHTFINVIYNAETYRVLFLEWCVDRPMPDYTFDYFDWV